MRGLRLALALAATTAIALQLLAPQTLAPTAARAEPLSAEANQAGIFRIIELKGSAVKWGGAQMGTGAVVTYAFATEAVDFPEARNCRAMEPMAALLAKSGIDKALYEAEAAEAFEAWSAVADIEFRRVDDTEAADILIGAQTKPIGRAFTNVSYSRVSATSVRPLEKSLICLNPEQLWKVGFDGDLDVYDLRYTLKHEIGHAIGLDHPNTTDQVMSFRYEERFAVLQSGDASGAVALYGGRRARTADAAIPHPASLRRLLGFPQPLARDHQVRALSPTTN
jgi:hypothetical protein